MSIPLNAFQKEILEKIRAAEEMHKRKVHVHLAGLQVGKLLHEARATLAYLEADYPAPRATVELEALKARIDFDEATATAAHQAALAEFLVLWAGRPANPVTVEVQPHFGDVALVISNVSAASPGELNEGILGQLHLAESCDLGTTRLTLVASGPLVAASHEEEDFASAAYL
jgi:hypothetical protein